MKLKINQISIIVLLLIACIYINTSIGFVSVSPVGAAEETILVYGDGFATNWKEAGYSRSIDRASTTYVYEGTQAIETLIQSTGMAYVQYGLSVPEYYPSDALTGVQFWIHGGPNGGQVVKFSIANEPYKFDNYALEIGPLAPDWQQIVVPFDQFDGLDQVTGFGWKNTSGADFEPLYIDQLEMLTNNISSSTATPTAASTSVGVTATSTPSVPTATATLPSATQTATAEPTPMDADAIHLRFAIDRTAVPTLYYNDITLSTYVGQADQVMVSANGASIPSSYSAVTGYVQYTTDAAEVQIDIFGGAVYPNTGVTEKTALKDGKLWAWSHGFDDNVNLNPAIDLFAAKGWRTTLYLIGSIVDDTRDEGWIVDVPAIERHLADGGSIGSHGWLNNCTDFTQEYLVQSFDRLDEIIADSAVPDYKVTSFAAPCFRQEYHPVVVDMRENGVTDVLFNESGNKYFQILDRSASDFTEGSYTVRALNLDNPIGRDFEVEYKEYSEIQSKIDWMVTQSSASQPMWYNSASHGNQEGKLSPIIEYVYNTYGAAGDDSVWMAPADEIVSYALVRELAAVTLTQMTTGGAPTVTPTTTAVATISATPTNTPSITSTPTAIATETQTPTQTPVPVDGDPIVEIGNNSGVAGYTISLFGSNFGSIEGYVTVLGSTAEITTWENDFVQLTVPDALAGSGDVVLVTSEGRSVNHPFTVYTIDPQFLQPPDALVNIAHGKPAVLTNLESAYCYLEPGSLAPEFFLTDYQCSSSGVNNSGEATFTADSDLGIAAAIAIDLETDLSGELWLKFFLDSSWYPPNNHGKSYPVDYTVQVSADSTDGQDGTWVTVEDVVGNNRATRLHKLTIPNGGYSWIRLHVTDAYRDRSGTAGRDFTMREIQIFQPVAGTTSRADTFGLYGDSLTAGSFDAIADSGFATAVKSLRGANYDLSMSAYGLSGQNSTGFVETAGNINEIHDAFVLDSAQSEITYWGLAIGTNDSNDGEAGLSQEFSNVSQYDDRLEALVQEMIADGKVPLLARIPDTDEAQGGYGDFLAKKKILADIDRIAATYRLIPGPDFYAPFRRNVETGSSSWFRDDGTHHVADGEVELIRLWAEAFAKAVPVAGTATPTPTPTGTNTPTVVPTMTSTPLPTITSTPLPTVIATNTPPPTATTISTPHPTATATATATATSTPPPTATLTPPPVSTGPKLVHGVVSNVGDGWQVVTLAESYSDMVVVTTAQYGFGDAPAVVRVRNASGNSFELRVQNPSGQALSGYTVQYMVVDAGVYTAVEHGVTMEAAKYTSTVTDGNGVWNGEARSYAQSYSSPVVFGQVMTANDDAWSVFWAHGPGRMDSPTSDTLYTGKGIAQDTANTTRADETIGYVVMESGVADVDGVRLRAAVGTDSVYGFDTTNSYSHGFVEPPETVVLSTSGLDGSDGGWPVLYGASPINEAEFSLVFDEDQIGDSERNHTNEPVAYVAFETLPPVSSDGPKLAHGVVASVSDSWQTVTLAENYDEMVVVTTAQYGFGDAPAVVRVRNASGNSFEMRVQNPSGQPLSGYTVQYVVVEAGVYTAANHGITMEAVTYTSAVTDGNGVWNGELRSYAQSYSSPVVLGQVMTANDDAWSVFWAHGPRREDSPTSGALYTGKGIAQDTANTTRADETIGYIVVESGSAQVGGLTLVAAVGSDSVYGFDTTNSYNHGMLGAPETVVLATSGLDGGDGGWPVLYGANAINGASFDLVFDEDQIGDSERAHTTEPVAYFAIR